MNRDAEAARRYHAATKHSVASLQAHRYALDWDIKPLPFKVYPHGESLPLPRALPPPPSLPALAAIAIREVAPGDAAATPDLTALARVLHFSAGITRKKEYPGGEEYYFRAAACTGALYHIDLYVICGDLPGLSAGVYHFGPHDFSLYRLRAGDHRGVLVNAAGAEPSLQHAPAILACASTYWRNSWKYQARAYRHCFWDSGTILANLMAVAAAQALPARVVCGFVDETVSGALGLDAEREAPLALVALGHVPPATPACPAPAAIAPETLPLSAHAVDYPAIREMQAASALRSAPEVAAWRAAAQELPAPAAPSGRVFPLQALAPGALPAETIEDVIRRRGSTRRFAPLPISAAQLGTILDRATHGIAADYGASRNDIYLIVNAVDGLPSGTYVYHRERRVLEQLRAGSFRREAGHLALGQDLAADASVNVYQLCDLEAVLRRFGNRGYRVAQLDAAVTGGKLYLAAYALRLGATGLTFFDDDVTAFFSPHAAGKGVMFLLAIGRDRRQAAA